MDDDVVEARYRGGYVIWLRFRDNTSSEIDLEKEPLGPVFEPLRDLAVFTTARPTEARHRSLDHGIGVRIPAAQPQVFQERELRPNSFHLESLPLN